MERKLSKRALSLKPSPIQDLSYLAQRCNAINLAEGFPDFPAPSELKDAAIAAINADFNQYRHVQGLCDYIAQSMKLNHGLDVDPVNNVAICCGQSEAFAAAILSVIDEADEVLLLDPAYETYEACVAMAGGIPVYVALDPPHWTLNIDKLVAACTSRTKAIVLNSPHNPTGKVFSRDELMIIAETCCRMDFLAITDEVYEHITFGTEQISLASLPGMQERTIITSSLSKTYSVTGRYGHLTHEELFPGAIMGAYSHDRRMQTWSTYEKDVDVFRFSRCHSSTTRSWEHSSIPSCCNCNRHPHQKLFELSSGWRVGWAVAPTEITSSIRNIHVKLTDSAPAPFQEAALVALKSSPEYFQNLRMEYKERRDFIADLLEQIGFKVHFKPQGAVFVFAELPETCTISDVEYVAKLIKIAGVAAVPGCGFFHGNETSSNQDSSHSAMSPIHKPGAMGSRAKSHTSQDYRNRYIRFAYCKSKATLLAAGEKLHKCKDRMVLDMIDE